MEFDEVRLAIEPYISKLAAFTSAEEIRDFLVAEEVCGVPCDWKSCAIAEYVNRNTGAGIKVGSTNTFVSEANVLKIAGGNAVRLSEHTPAMRDFVINFDGRAYPELERY